MAEHGATKPRVDDAVVPRRVFLAVGGLVAALALLYWLTSDEDAGAVLLALTAVLALWCGVFLWLQTRTGRLTDADAARDMEGAEAAALTYLPHASVWPFAMGLGAALILDGMVLGIWVVVRGVGLTALGIAGFIRQTRRRD